MGTSRIAVTATMIEDMIFGPAPSPIKIKHAVYDPNWHVVEFEIEGVDVPDAPKVFAEISVETNRAGDRLRRMTFKPKQ